DAGGGGIERNAGGARLRRRDVAARADAVDKCERRNAAVGGGGGRKGDAVGVGRIVDAVAVGRVAHPGGGGRVADAVAVRGHLRDEQRHRLRAAGGAEHGAVDARGAGGDAARGRAAHVVLAGEQIAAQVGDVERGRAVAGAVRGRDEVEQVGVGQARDRLAEGQRERARRRRAPEIWQRDTAGDAGRDGRQQ